MNGEKRFTDRRHAGRELAAHLTQYAARDDVVVLALPRGGVPVAYEVALSLDVPLDVYLVRKLGVPGHEELGFGAVGPQGVLVLNDDVVRELRLPESVVEDVTRRERDEVARREQVYREEQPATEIAGKIVLVIDDGLATGSTMRAAVRALRAARAARIVVAVPVAPASACSTLRAEADEVVCVLTPHDMWAVGAWYNDFTQTEDLEARRLLSTARSLRATRRTLDLSGIARAGRDDVIGGDMVLQADLTVPASPRGLVVFAHGSGSTRHSPRNRAVAQVLQRAGLATLLMDLLTEQEEREDAVTGEYRFDIGLLSARLLAATDRMAAEADVAELPLAYFGASTGAAAALMAAAQRAQRLCAVVSRGGRADMAGEALALVHTPTLLIVGGADTAVLELNELARRAMRCETRLDVIPGATHLFEEPGALERVAELARDWVVEHLPRAGAQPERRADAA